jgi:hypothetical protein
MDQTVDPTAYNSRPSVRDHLARAAKLAPLARYVPKHPALLVGAAVLGLVGMMAWRNRERIAEKARPMLQNAAERGAALRERLPIGRSDATAP